MAGKRYDPMVKEQVFALRSAGKSYAEIQKEFSIPKSTLSVWMGEKYAGIFDRKAQLAHLKRVRVIAAHAIQMARIERDSISIEQGRATARNIPLTDTGVLKALLAMLYWAEGSKFEGVSGVRFVNTDPHLILLYITLLRKCFPVDEGRLRIRLHLHYYHNKKKSVAYWSSLIGVPESQFGKLYIKKRSPTKKFRKNFMGICFIYYPGNGMRKEILELGNMIYVILCNQKLS